MNQRKNKKVKMPLNFNLILLIMIPLAFVGVTAAKYVQNINLDILYEAKSFYFESDALYDNTNPMVYTYEKGKDNITLKIRNNADELRYSEVDIDYTVNITDMYGYDALDKDGNLIEKVTGKLSKGGVDEHTVTFSNLNSGTYIVTAKATKPYTKTINATFLLLPTDNTINYNINDAVNSPVLQLTLATTDYSGKIKITWPEGVAPDTTIHAFANLNVGYNGGSVVIDFIANSEYTFQFFKKDVSATYSNADFGVERSQ